MMHTATYWRRRGLTTINPTTAKSAFVKTLKTHVHPQFHTIC
uniref:Uncharacterized protein n=1 Tax=Anguilla anguilla TaxID=7936 RepID=A0A0E9VVP1_ANGAN